ncbi:uncharacterized protein LOC130674302 [Microplitis mediator]|uniref:uncharacterized protein LOC130674302 n=1 Tax=Microplitis mediator TaxID=375433 RepID=UPI002554A79F|nr:uncharacterized protein LOC130674302 [Microplitis mediator]
MPKRIKPGSSRSAIIKRNRKRLKSFLLSAENAIRPIPPNFLENMPQTSDSRAPSIINEGEEEDRIMDNIINLHYDGDTYFGKNDYYFSASPSSELNENVCDENVAEEMIDIEDNDDEEGFTYSYDNDNNVDDDDNVDDGDDDVDDDDDDDDDDDNVNDDDNDNDEDDNDDDGDDDDDDNDNDDDDNDDGDDDGDDDDDDNDNDDDENDDDSADNPFFAVSKVNCFQFPLIPNKNLSIIDHFLSIIATAIKHHMSYEAILDIFRWMKVSHAANRLPTTKAALWNILSRNKSMITPHYYCELCEGYLGTKNEKNLLKLMCFCKTCGPKKPEKHLGCFYSISLISQIKQLFKIPHIAQSLQYRNLRVKKNNEAFEDIYDGLEYQRLCSPGNFLEHWFNFSITFNTDGCQISNSSKASAWPVYAEINELPPHMRKKYVLLAAIYVGDTHPKMNNLLRPFTEQMRKLFTDGVTWKPSESSEVTSKFIVVASTLDAPARAAVVRMKQFNGYFSCVYCYAKGKSTARRLIFPFKQSYLKLRTENELKADMKYVIRTGNIRHGVKGYSSLTALPLFKITKGVIVETMHSVFLGVVKLHTTVLLKTVGAPYYIGKKQSLQIINKTLLSIKPPSRRSRKPRKVESCVQWKASEWRNWLDYAPVCLKSVLEDKYINHLAQLSEAIHYLNSDSITLQELNRADFLLKEYAKTFEQFFGEVKMSSNVHSLSHLVECIRNWGPMWAHNAFTFESWNRKIMDCLTSPVGREDQIITRFLMQRFINHVAFDGSISNETRSFIVKQLRVINDSSRIEHRDKFIVEKESRARYLSEEEFKVLHVAGYKPEHLTAYESMHVNGVKFSCLNETKVTKFSNSFIYSDIDGTFSTINNIIQFYSSREIITGIIVQSYKHIGYGFNAGHIHMIKPKKILNFIRDTYMIRPAIKMSTEDLTFAVKLANCWETD